MVVAMFAGMAVLALPAGLAMGAFGTSWSELAPEPKLLVMAVTMTVPMVAWMAYSGHRRRASAEMSASMFVPTFAVIGLLWADLVEGIGTLMVIEHVAMLASSSSRCSRAAPSTPATATTRSRDNGIHALGEAPP